MFKEYVMQQPVQITDYLFSNQHHEDIFYVENAKLNVFPESIFPTAPHKVARGSLLKHSTNSHSANVKCLSKLIPGDDPIYSPPDSGDGGDRSEEKQTTVWEVQNGGLIEQEDLKDYKLFKSNKAYVILQTESSMNTEGWNLFYWIGEKSSNVDAGNAASHSVVIDFQIHSKIRIQRQGEGKEMDVFKKLFTQKEPEISSVASTSNELLEETKNDANAKRMFVIQGKNELNWKEVPFNEESISDPEECVVFVSENVYVFCGRVASLRQKRGAVELAKIMLRRKGPNSNAKIIPWNPSMIEFSNEEKEKCLQCAKELADVGVFDEMVGFIVDREQKPIVKNPNEFTPKELRLILDESFPLDNGLERFRTVIYKVYEFHDELVSEERFKFPNPKDGADHCYLIDSRSNAGLFVWMGRESSINIRMECARRAEQYLRDEQYDFYTPITYVDTRDVPPEIYTVQGLINFHNPVDKNVPGGPVVKLFTSKTWEDFTTTGTGT